MIEFYLITAFLGYICTGVLAYKIGFLRGKNDLSLQRSKRVEAAQKLVGEA